MNVRRVCFFILFLAIFTCFQSGCAFLIRRPSYSVSKPPEKTAPYRGIYHVHTEFSGDSKAPLKQVIKIAKKTGLDFVLISDHNNMKAREAAAKMVKKPGDPLLIVGVEISAPEGHMIGFGIDEPPARGPSSQELIDWIHERGGYVFLAHPIDKRRPWVNWSVKGFDGLEVYNFAHTFYSANRPSLAAKVLFFTPKMFIKSYNRTHPKSFEKWDELLKEGRMTGVGAVDAHVHWKRLGLAPESYILQMQAVTNYVLAEKFDEHSIVDAWGKGKSFMAFEARGEARNFSFEYESDGKRYAMGSEISAPSGEFLIHLPREAQIRIIRNGEIMIEHKGRELRWRSEGPGAYRAEIYRKGKPWIVSNPIYVTGRSSSDLSGGLQKARSS